MNYFELSSTTTWDIVQKHIDENWDWVSLGNNPNITFENIFSTINKPWNWFVLSMIKATWNDVKDNLDKPWNWMMLSQNSNITWDIIQENKDKPWDYGAFSMNPNFRKEIALENPDKPFNWRHLYFKSINNNS